MISVLLVDDQPLIRTALRTLIDSEDDMRVVAEASDGWAAVESAKASSADVVLMDIQMPGRDGIEACREICSSPALSHVKVIMLTTFEDDVNVVRSLRAGASGFIGKTIDTGTLIHSIRTVFAGEALLSPRATRALIDRFVAPDKIDPPALADLTARELEVLTLVARGRDNNTIASDLGISPMTVKTHVNRIMTKVDAHDRAQLVILAYEAGIFMAR